MSVGGPQQPISQHDPDWTGEPYFNVDKMPTRGEKLARTEREILIDIADLLARQTAVLELIRAALGSSSDSRSSVEVKTSTRGVDVASKCYADSPMDGLSERAVAEYFATLDKVQVRVDERAAK